MSCLALHTYHGPEDWSLAEYINMVLTTNMS